MSGVSPAEGDVSVGESNQPVVGDGDAVGIGAEIAQQVFWTTEGRLGIDDPVLAEQQSEPGCEGSWFGEWSEGTVELDLGFAESILESGDELTRNTRLSTLTGRKKERWEEIQRAWSGARPPAATTQ